MNAPLHHNIWLKYVLPVSQHHGSGILNCVAAIVFFVFVLWWWDDRFV